MLEEQFSTSAEISAIPGAPTPLGTSSNAVNPRSRLRWSDVIRSTPEQAYDPQQPGSPLMAHQMVDPCAVRIKRSLLSKLKYSVNQPFHRCQRGGSGYFYLQVSIALCLRLPCSLRKWDPPWGPPGINPHFRVRKMRSTLQEFKLTSFRKVKVPLCVTAIFHFS